jgi:hypothetical protein
LCGSEARDCVPVQQTLAVEVEAMFARSNASKMCRCEEHVRHVVKGTMFEAVAREMVTSGSAYESGEH